MAQKEHWCDVCCRHIEPGEMYKGQVYVSKAHGIYTFKEHTDPSCDYPEDPDDEKDREDEDSENLENRVEQTAAEVRKAA